jgi:hypothetical protein
MASVLVDKEVVSSYTNKANGSGTRSAALLRDLIAFAQVKDHSLMMSSTGKKVTSWQNAGLARVLR